MLARIATTLIGVVLFVYGVVAALSPLPLGAPLAIFGLILIAAANPAARPLVRRMRRKWKWFDRLVRFVGARSPPRYKVVIDETHPDEDEPDEETSDTSPADALKGRK